MILAETTNTNNERLTPVYCFRSVSYVLVFVVFSSAHMFKRSICRCGLLPCGLWHGHATLEVLCKMVVGT